MSSKVIPVLRIFDYAKTVEFYVDWLDFKIDWEHRFDDNSPLYLQVSREHITLHLSEHHGDSCPGAKVFIEFPNIAAYHHYLTDKDYKFNKPGLEKSPWDTVCMEVIDPFGNKLLFSESRDEAT
jgi:catechol 2,3-dioxygenase-like lactoylglutathione lyase family enzyme